MAVRIDAAGDFIGRTSDFPQVDGFAVSMWFYMQSDRNAAGAFFTMINATGTVYQGLYFRTTGTTLTIDVNGTLVDGSELAAGNWYHLFYQRIGSTHTAYLNGALNITNNTGLAITPAFMFMGSNSVANLDGRLAAIKIWSGLGVAFTADEVVREMRTIRPQRMTGLYLWSPVFTGATERLKDYSGNARNWTANGTLTDEDGPPVSWGGRSLLSPYAAAGGDPERTGAASLSLGVLTVASAGVNAIAGASSLSLGVLTLSGAGAVATAGAASLSIGTLTNTAAGAGAIEGSASLSLGVLSVSGAGAVASTGAGSVSLGALTVSGDGSNAIVGDSSLTLGAITLSASSEVSDEITGTASLSLGALATSAAGEVAIVGDASLIFGAVSVSGNATSAIAGGASVPLSAITLFASSTVEIVGTASLALGVLTVSAIENLPTGIVNNGISVSQPNATASVNQPNAAITARKPSITFTSD